jgi:hypothetical protein
MVMAGRTQPALSGVEGSARRARAAATAIGHWDFVHWPHPNRCHPGAQAKRAPKDLRHRNPQPQPTGISRRLKLIVVPRYLRGEPVFGRQPALPLSTSSIPTNAHPLNLRREISQNHVGRGMHMQRRRHQKNVEITNPMLPETCRDGRRGNVPAAKIGTALQGLPGNSKVPVPLCVLRGELSVHAHRKSYP